MAWITTCLILLDHITTGQTKVHLQSDATLPISNLTEIESTYMLFPGNPYTLYSKPPYTQIEPMSILISDHLYILFPTPSSSERATTDASLSEHRHAPVSTSTSTEKGITSFSLSQVPFTSVHGDGGIEQTITIFSAFMSLSIASSPVAVQSQVHSQVTSSDTDANIPPAGTTKTSITYVVSLQMSEEPLFGSFTLPSTTILESPASHVIETQHSSFKTSGFPLKSSQTLVATLETASQYKQLQDTVISTKQILSSSTSEINPGSSDTTGNSS